MTRFLPPLLLALVFAVIGVRYLEAPSRALARERIASLVEGAETRAAAEELERYLDRHQEAEDRWFAARMWLRMHRPLAALDTVFGPDGPGDEAETTRRFAETALLTVGWEGEARRDPTVLEPFALLALVEGGHPWAEERLRTYASEMELLGVTTYFFPAILQATAPAMDVIVPALRARPDQRFLVGAALGALGPLARATYPEKDGDVATLAQVVGSAEWRHQFRDVWCASAVALGRSESPAAVEALEQAEALLEGSENHRDQLDLRMLRNGLIAAGRFEALPSVAAWVFGPTPDLKLNAWYLEALLYRYRLGDKRSEIHLRRLWEGPGARHLGLRYRSLRAILLLPAEVPQPKAVGPFADRMLRELAAPEAGTMGRVLGLAWRLRSGAPQAREQMLDAVYEMARSFEAGGGEGLTQAFVEALRALYLYV